MEVATASHYDGATATAEAALMACRLTHRDRVAVSTAVNPQVRRVLETYCSGPGIEVIEVPADLAAGGSGLTPVEEVERLVDEEVACFVAQQPNFFGGVEPMAAARRRGAPCAGAQLMAHSSSRPRWRCSPRPAATAPTSSPRRGSRSASRSRSADPYVGLMAAPMASVRQMPGPPGGRDAGRIRAPGLRPHPAGPRAAHPPREGGEQHLHQPGALRPCRDHLPLGGRARGAAGGRRAVDGPGAPPGRRHRGRGPRGATLQRAVRRGGGASASRTRRGGTQPWSSAGSWPGSSWSRTTPSCATACCWPRPS